jgi:hypothetical protein
MNDIMWDPNTTVGNHVVTLPTPETLRRLEDILMSSPLEINPFETFHVTLYVAPDLMMQEFAIRPSEQYLGQVINFYPWYDSFDHSSKLVAFLDSPQMVLRNIELSGGTSRYSYQPHLTFVSKMPPLSMSIKPFIVSVADTLVLNEGPFTFQGEYVLDSSGYQVSNPGIEAIRGQ